MKFSIIIPVYNVEKYIEECVTSALSLKTDIEIILVDDGSTDKSGEICDSLALNDSRIKVIHKSNGGLISARKAGIEAATGEYICLLLAPEGIEKAESQDIAANHTDSFSSEHDPPLPAQQSVPVFFEYLIDDPHKP